ncbi:hypothetical protein FK535_11360 [Mycolicibacterium sp. 018/SC-01/001]|uniref:hypothetical protein n=1 Tax=Mycolicibacterium sp. 018/SC-01/001 TaxID=2592069 RepID=UPI00117EC318|nr:hypothetical protein [Mycolicibacterium sp. 018/SC-01/001]TRW83256.1 hypothetical protein FK535_11360 [Mycolicibacterium sp. 018/SC-01/001]
MTTAQEFGDAIGRPGTVSIAGVPWPTYKLVALVIGLLVFAAVAVTTATAAAAVLSGAGAATVVWLTAGLLQPSRR